jgi:hypothetical protein
LSLAKNLITSTATVGALLSAIFLAEAFWFADRHSVTYDETIYLNLSLQSVRDRRLDPGFMTLGVAPLPALITYAGPILFTRTPIEPSQDRSEAPANAPQLIRAPRFLNSLLVGVPLVVTVFLWLHRRRGLAAATLGGGLAALSPTLVAHGALATTDASLALFSTLGMAAIAWFATAPSAARLLVCAVAVAAAMSAKYSGLFLLPAAAGVFLLSSVRRQQEQRGTVSARRALREFIVHSALLACLALPLWWGAHLFARATPQDFAAFEGAQRPDLLPPPNSFPDFAMTLAPMVGLQHQFRRNREGDEAFLMGERSPVGWWYYFPVVFLFKSTPVELALVSFLIVAAGVSYRHPWRTLTALDSSMQCLLVAGGVVTGLLLTSHLNLGHRYMIPVYPILIIVACDQLAVRLGSRHAWLTATAAGLLVIQAWSSLTIAPHYLAYLNRFSGGPENGWRLLADSSLDWGQDLPGLRAYLDAHYQERAVMKYFGTALPEAYGVRADDIEHLKARPEEYALLALSATHLNGLHLAGRDPFKEFRRLEPVAQVGYSIMMYDLRRPDALFAFREALKAFH